ncbi:hypothetical protein Tco_0506955, partial [Tanacetum coccineum]
MIVALETVDRTPRPTVDFTRKTFANMKFKWEGQPIPLTLPMLAVAAAGDEAAGNDDAANETTIPVTEAVVPTPVSPVTNWRPCPYVFVHSPIRDHT